MRTRKEVDDRRAAKCKHFNGIMNDYCESKFKYSDLLEDKLPCWGEVECDGYCPLGAAELKKQDAESIRRVKLIGKGLSPCCEAPFDTRCVITEGKYKNHGPRYCSKCHELVFIV